MQFRHRLVVIAAAFHLPVARRCLQRQEDELEFQSALCLALLEEWPNGLSNAPLKEVSKTVHRVAAEVRATRAIGEGTERQ